MRFLCLDLATKTGWALGSPGQRPTLGVHDMARAGDHVGRFLNCHKSWMTAALESGTITHVFFELPVLARVSNIKTLTKLYGLSGVTQMLAREYRLPVQGYQSTTIKKVMTGSGRADKDQMVAAARARGFNPQDDNAADALGLFLTAVKEHAAEKLSCYAAKGALL